MQLNSTHNAPEAPVLHIRTRLTRRAIPVAVAAGLAVTVALGVPRGVTAEGAQGREHPRACSNATLRGNYGFDIGGEILAGPRAGLLRAVAMTQFDGHGNLTQVDFATINGIPTGQDWRPGTGTYEINPDCTGTAQIVFTDGSPTLRLRVVVVDRGNQIFTVVEGNATGSTGIKVTTRLP